MTRAQLDRQYTTVIRKWARSIADMGGRVPLSLLDDLAAVAEHHATEVVGELLPPVAERPAARRTRKAAAP